MRRFNKLDKNHNEINNFNNFNVEIPWHLVFFDLINFNSIFR
jgi:hypothetical protein